MPRCDSDGQEHVCPCSLLRHGPDTVSKCILQEWGVHHRCPILGEENRGKAAPFSNQLSKASRNAGPACSSSAYIQRNTVRGIPFPSAQRTQGHTLPLSLTRVATAPASGIGGGSPESTVALGEQGVLCLQRVWSSAAIYGAN